MHTLLKEEQSIASNADGIWLNSHFLHWWLLPSLHVHASWLPRLVADVIAPLPDSDSAIYAPLHQHWSSQLLSQQAVDTAALSTITSHPALPLCMASPALLDPWLQHAGMLMSSPQLRRCIDRASRLHVQQGLGPQALTWAVQIAPQLHAGLTDITQLQWHDLELAESMRWLGSQLLWTVLEGAPSALRERLLWLLPMHWQSLPKPQIRWPSSAEALAVSLQLMNTLDSAWLSSLPKTH